MNQILTEYYKIPKPIRVFLLRALIIFVAWKSIYILGLQPGRILDRPLTDVTSHLTAVIYAKLSGGDVISVNGEKDIIYVNGRRMLSVMDGCNGLELFVVYIGFLLCMPAGRKKFWMYTILGVAAIFILNILRCVGLTWLVCMHKQYADFAHHYLFKLIIYGFIFYCWVQYSRNYMKHEA